MTASEHARIAALARWSRVDKDGLRRWQRYRLRHPERRKDTDRRGYQRRRRDDPLALTLKSRLQSERRVRLLFDGYVRFLLQEQKQPITDENIEQTKNRLRIKRSKHAFRILATAGLLGNLQ